MKHLVRFNEMRLLTPSITSKEDEVVSEFQRIIEINHKCDGDLESALRSIYQQGYIKGKTLKMFGSNGPQKPFNLEKTVQQLVDSCKPQRISNHRDITYNGPEVTSNKVLACDIGVQGTIEEMKGPDDGPQHFNVSRMSKEFYDSELREAYDDEERNWIVREYNQLEVQIFFYKCYQVAISEGETNTPEAPHGVEEIFSAMKRIADYRAGKQVRRFKNEQDVAKYELFIDYLKQQTPNWEQYAEYYDVVDSRY